MLFRAIIDEIDPKPDNKSSLVQLFWKGQYIKKTECQKCSYPLNITEDIFILRVKGINYTTEKSEDGTLFQSTKELRSCEICQVQTDYHASYTFESLPEILVLAISDLVETRSSPKLIPNISIKTSNSYFNSKIVSYIQNRRWKRVEI